MTSYSMTDALREARRIVDEQAEDEGLWLIAESVVEGYFQQELRRLHAAVEAVDIAALEEQLETARREAEGARFPKRGLHQFADPPPMLAIDAAGYVWRVYDEFWSMAPSNPDNDPVPEPVTFYAPFDAALEHLHSASEEPHLSEEQSARRRELDRQRLARKHVSGNNELGFTYRPTPPSGPPPSSAREPEERT